LLSFLTLSVSGCSKSRFEQKVTKITKEMPAAAAVLAG
jgi:hypothetical protein